MDVFKMLRLLMNLKAQTFTELLPENVEMIFIKHNDNISHVANRS